MRLVGRGLGLVLGLLLAWLRHKRRQWLRPLVRLPRLTLVLPSLLGLPLLLSVLAACGRGSCAPGAARCNVWVCWHGAAGVVDGYRVNNIAKGAVWTIRQ